MQSAAATREYVVDGNTFLLNPRDAKLLGAHPVRVKAARAPANKARRRPANKAAAVSDEG